MDPAATEQQAPQGSSRAADQSAPSWRSRFWNAIGGAVLGAGMGYFASQLASGGLGKMGRISRTRREWAFAGGSVGLAAGFAFPFLGRGVPMAPHVSANPRMTITAREISESAATTAYEAVSPAPYELARQLEAEPLRGPDVRTAGTRLRARPPSTC